MFFHSPLQLILRRWKLILLVGILLGGLSVAISALFPLEYRADAQVLIIPQSRYGVDPYTIAKSAEQIGGNLKNVIKTNDFYTKLVAQPQFALDLSRFQNVTDRTMRKRWGQAVDASVVYGTGLLNLSAYNTDPEQAKMLVSAVMSAMISYGNEYVGSEVTIKVVNSPVVTLLPARPNLILSGLAGLVLGMLLMMVIVGKKR